MLFCKHSWKVLVDETIPPPVDKLKNYEGTSASMAWAFKLTKINIFACEKCGKIKKIVTGIEYT